LWNAFIVAGYIGAFLRLVDGSFSSIAIAISRLAEHIIEIEGTLFDQLYERLPPVDFSRDVPQGHESMLQVLHVPHCGWTDLGTPQRSID
jgi:mannose-1-phosphate guanylyltransferase